MLEAAMDDLAKLQRQDSKDMLAKAIRLHCLSYVRENLGWYMSNGVVSINAAKKIEGDYQNAIQQVLVNVNDWLDAFALPMHAHLHAPISRDYVTYSGTRDHANVAAAGKLFDASNSRL